LTPAQEGQLTHELQVHQIELEMQNEELRRAQAALETAQARYFDLYNLAPVGYVTLAENGLIQEANLTAATLLGVTRERLVQQPLGSFVCKDDRDAYYLCRRKLSATGAPQTCEVRLLRAHAAPFWATLEVTATRDDAGALVCRIVLSDSTGLKRAERIKAARLCLFQFAGTHALNEFLRCLLDKLEALTGSLVGFYHFVEADQNTLTLQAWSTRTEQELCKAAGQGRHYAVAAAGVWVDCIRERRPVVHNDYASLPHRKGLPPGHAPIIRELVVPVLRGDRIVAVLGVGNKPSLYDDDDVQLVSELADLAWDLVERKQVQEALQASETEFRSLFETGALGMAQANPHTGRFLRVNEKMCLLTGYSREELLALSIRDLTHPDDRAADGKLFQRVIKGAQPDYQLEKRYLRKDGTQLWVRVNVAVVRNTQGRPLHTMATIEDITARKRTEAEQVQLEARAWQLQKAESLGRMAGAIAHHFNNQLQVVAGNLELVGIPKDAGTAECLDAALQATRQAIKISRLMLTYLGQTTEAHIALDLSELCRQSLPLIQSATPVVVQSALAEPGPVIRANAQQLQQMLTNLITNAAESGGASRGAVRLFVKTVSAQEIPAAQRFPLDWQPQAQDYVCLGVADAGCGIAPENLEKIFDPFFSSKFTGRGLGLPVVLGLVRVHHGCITVESEPGQGSTFQLFFPALSRAALPPAQPRPAPGFAGGGTVLLVDDEEPVRKLTTTMLTRLGFTVLTAADGCAAVEVFRQHQAAIRCVLTDLTMPGMDGWATLAALRALRAELPVILSSGYDETNALAGAGAERPQAFLSKPYTVAALREALGHALEVSDPVAQTPPTDPGVTKQTGRPCPPESAP
jgi:PAS domain S-box-containing protein